MDDLLQEFIAETRETLEALSGEIVAWEARPDDRDRLDAIFRFVHTVKGSCGFLDLPRLARLSHAAEDVLAAVRSGERVPDTRLVSAVLAIVDRIGELVEAIDAGHPLDDSGEDLLIAGLDKQSTIVAPTPASAAVRAPTRSVRLNVDLLDRMMSGMSDMVLARNELARRLRVDGADPTIEASLERLSLTVAEMRDTVTRTRMQKIDALFSALPRMVRDTAAELGKAVRLDVEGSDVELDREMIEMMRDPLVHIVRNSIDHGIESPAERVAAGKRNEGRLTVTARQSGNQIIIEIADDGRGIDVERLITKVAKQGGRSEAELRALNPKAKLDLVFEAGISTKDVVTAVSGRGVGMDVVRANVEQIGGRIDLTSVQGVGLRIAIHVPLTLSIIATIGVGVGDQRFAISRQAIEEIVRVGGDTIRIDMLGNTPAATIRDRRMPLVNLARALGIDPSDTAATPVAAMLVIVSVSGGSYALAVDSVLDHEELVIKPATPAVMASGVYAGQTLPDSGLPMLLLDCGGVAASAGLQFTREVAADDDIQGVEEVGTSALLFEDLDGVRRLVPLEVVDRIDPVPVDAIRFTAGRLHLSVDDRIIPLSAIGDWSGRHSIPVLRLRDGAAELGYAISEALDIVTLPTDLIAAREVGQIAGVVMLGGEQIELLDLHYLFADLDKSDRTTQPLCLIGGVDAGWIATFLSPAVEAAGYRVSRTLRAGEVPTIIMMMDDDVPLNEQHPQAGAETARGKGSAKEEGPGIGATPVVRLRRERGGGNDGGIYRYDRAAIVAELARQSDRSDGVTARSAGGR